MILHDLSGGQYFNMDTGLEPGQMECLVSLFKAITEYSISVTHGEKHIPTNGQILLQRGLITHEVFDCLSSAHSFTAGVYSVTGEQFFSKYLEQRDMYISIELFMVLVSDLHYHNRDQDQINNVYKSQETVNHDQCGLGSWQFVKMKCKDCARNDEAKLWQK